MSAYLNRAVSMVAGNNGMASSSFDTNSISENRTFANDKSPLQIFVKAKKRINDIYDEINEYVIETFHFVSDLPSNIDIVDKSEKELFESYIFKVAAIREVLHRDHMKVAFFGRTSNGKSSVINAMLKDKILPSGIGHTTNCFCQVEGVDGEDAYLVKEGSDEKLNVVNIKQLANALCQEKLSESSLVRIYWPRERCHLLRDDVVFVDSPGVDVSANLDDWIDNHCLDADVFVLVLNAESTMTLAEKSFFHTVSKKLSKPNVFVLNNRWDAAADEIEFQESVRSQHLERCLDFLSKELKVCSEKEAAERVFFVSAKETLNARIYESKGQPPNLGAISDGFQTRYFEFLDFERKFEECISKSAVKTKFEQHSSRGRNIGNDMHLMLENIYDRSNVMKKEKGDTKKKLTDRIQSTESNLMQITREMKQKIHNMVEEVEKKVSTALNEEIWRLGVLVDEFSMPFHSEPLVLNIYKKELNAHVEAGLGSNLRARLSIALATNIESAQCEMSDRMHSLISSETVITQNKQIMTRSQPFEMLYSLNCQNLCSDFQENLDFKFSWGITSMINRFTGTMKTNGKKSLTVIHRQGNAIERVSSVQSILENPTIQAPRMVDGITPEQISTVSRIVLASIGSQGTVGGLVVAGILFKTIGWRILFGVGALYGCVYIYERLSWTTASKERAFKSQYVDHATKKLKMIVDLTSANCSHQVQQELSSTFARLCRVVDTATTDMNKELKEIEHSLACIETNQKSIKLLRNKASYILNELDIFENNYIKSN